MHLLMIARHYSVTVTALLQARMLNQVVSLTAIIGGAESFENGTGHGWNLNIMVQAVPWLQPLPPE